MSQDLINKSEDEIIKETIYENMSRFPENDPENVNRLTELVGKKFEERIGHLNGQLAKMSGNVLQQVEKLREHIEDLEDKKESTIQQITSNPKKYSDTINRQRELIRATKDLSKAI